MSNLTYMAALATGGPERDVILEWTIKQDYRTVTFFRQVYLLSKLQSRNPQAFVVQARLLCLTLGGA